MASITVSTLPPGIDNLVAKYSGDANNSYANSNTAQEAVAKAGQTPSALTLALTSSGAAVTSVASGTPVTLTATATSSGPPGTRGTVVFCDASVSSACTGLAVLGSAQLTSNGTAAIALRLGIGTHSLEAIFNGAGSAGLAISMPSPLTVTGKYPTSTVMYPLQYPSSPSSYMLRAQIQAVAPSGIPSPSGMVQFVDTSVSNTVLDSVEATPDSYQPYLFNSTAQTPETGAKPFAIVAGDFNRDGIPDLVVANSGNNTVINPTPSLLTCLFRGFGGRSAEWKPFLSSRELAWTDRGFAFKRHSPG